MFEFEHPNDEKICAAIAAEGPPLGFSLFDGVEDPKVLEELDALLPQWMRTVSGRDEIVDTMNGTSSKDEVFA